MTERDRRHRDLLLAALAGLTPEPAPPEGARERMRALLMKRAAADSTGAPESTAVPDGTPTPEGIALPGTLVTRNEDAEWKTILPGVHVRTLRIDRDAGTQTTLWRLDPGGRVPPHPHAHEEECLVIEGSLIQDGVEYLPGDFLLAQAGSRHSPFHSPRGALFLIRGECVPGEDVFKRLS